MSNKIKILVIRLSSLGDVLLTSPFIRVLRKKYPNAQIDFFVKKQYSQIYKCNPNISNVIEFTKENSNEIFRKIIDAKYDIAVDLQNNLRTSAILRKLACKKYFFRKRNLLKFLLVKFKINRLKDFPLIPDRYIYSFPELLPDNKGLELFLPENQQKNEFSPKRIALCPGSKHFTKMWPFEYYKALSKMLLAENYEVVLVGGKDDSETCEKLCMEVKGIKNWVSDNDIFDISAKLKSCNIVICNDSGMMHTACAVDKPLIAIFGPTVKELGFFPYNNPKAIVLENGNLKCRPCTHIGGSKCPKKHFECMISIKPDKVFETIKIMENNK